jgi:hypothetical protein
VPAAYAAYTARLLFIAPLREHRKIYTLRYVPEPTLRIDHLRAAGLLRFPLVDPARRGQ